jgi:hypothetical protein
VIEGHEFIIEKRNFIGTIKNCLQSSETCHEEKQRDRTFSEFL